MIIKYPVDKSSFIIDRCIDMDVMDIGCIRHCVSFCDKPDWLHNKIKRVAKSLAGIDTVKSNIENVICHDITKPLFIDKKFDVIVAGDLIEHLSDFEGFFLNISRLLKPDGILIITTPNPFNLDNLFYIILKNRFSINPEHTCWIDPVCLKQLSARYGYEIREIRYLKNGWKLSDLICENEKHKYNILTGEWSNNYLLFRIYKKLVSLIFHPIFCVFKALIALNCKLIKYTDYVAVLHKTITVGS